MTLTFDKAPLIEIIAELRWNPLPPSGATMSSVAGISPVSASSFDEFFMRFGGEVYQHGFQGAERLVPPGFPTLIHQPVYRYRSKDASVLYQIGAGVFTANATPPYKSWDTFSPSVSNGVKALLKTRGESDRAAQIASVNLRYLDAFDMRLTEGRDVGAFLQDILGLKIEIPAAISKHAVSESHIKPSVQLTLPLSNGMTMHMSLSEGLFNNNPVIFMDTSVGTGIAVSADEPIIMQTLQNARVVIHETFVDLTKGIAHLMAPIESV